MKILGFSFDSRPTVERHTEELRKKFRKRLWLLRNLKYARADAKDLVDCYSCFLRPVLEYCCSVYHPMLNSTQSTSLEKLQYAALKIIFGYNHEKADLLRLSGLSTLEERRKKLFENFCQKIHKNERFRNIWLQERVFEGHDLRRQRIIVEKYARTQRLYKSPIYSIRRKLNDLNVS